MSIATSNFLIPNSTLIVELVGFLIVLFVISKYAVPLINKALKDRADQIQGAIAAADEAKADASAADQERRAALEAARQQAREIIEQANRTAEQVAVDAQERGHAEYERLVTAATREIELARQRALEEASNRLGQVVMEVVERVIGREVDNAAHRDLIEEAVTALSRGDVDGAAAGAGSRS